MFNSLDGAAAAGADDPKLLLDPLDPKLEGADDTAGLPPPYRLSTPVDCPLAGVLPERLAGGAFDAEVKAPP